MTDPIADLEPEWLEAADTEEGRAAATQSEYVPFYKQQLDHMRDVLAGRATPDHRNSNYGGKQ